MPEPVEEDPRPEKDWPTIVAVVLFFVGLMIISAVVFLWGYADADWPARPGE